MIGQRILLDVINKLVEDNNFPLFSIIYGEKGSGKRTLCNYISKKLNIVPYIVESNSIDSIRQVIQDAYKIKNPVVYIISDIDTMSVPAKNSLLKVTEEPPNNAYFLCTAVNEEGVLKTLQSRSYGFHILPYSQDNVKEYLADKNLTEDEESIIFELCTNIGEVEQLLALDSITDFYNYVEKVVDNIASASGANVFKLEDSLSFKEEDNKYNIQMFFKAFISICLQRMKQNKDNYYASGISITSKYLQELNRLKGVSKKMLVDSWILDIRKEWME